MSKRKELKAELDKLVKEFAVLQSRGKPDGVRTQLDNFVKKVGAAKGSWESAVAAKTTGTRTLKKNTAKKAMEVRNIDVLAVQLLVYLTRSCRPLAI